MSLFAIMTGRVLVKAILINCGVNIYFKKFILKFLENIFYLSNYYNIFL